MDKCVNFKKSFFITGPSSPHSQFMAVYLLDIKLSKLTSLPAILRVMVDIYKSIA